MTNHFFISYSSVDSPEFALKLSDKLAAGPPSFSVWLDKRNIRPSGDWDEQIVEAIKTCKGMIFVMTLDSVDPNSVCKNEWVSALRYKKPVIPLLYIRDAELPFRLGSREYIDFSGSFDSALARLRDYLSSMDMPEGQLEVLKYRLADARRDLPRAQNDDLKARIQDEIIELERQIAQQKSIIENPQAAKERVQQNIDRGLERVREPEKPMSIATKSKFINPPPLIAPTWFQDRFAESKIIGDFLKDEALRIMTVVGRGGVGKTAMVCRLLRSVQAGQLPDDGGSMTVDGIVYLSDARSFHRVNVPDFYISLTKLLSEETIRQLDLKYKNPQTSTREKIQAILDAFPGGRTVVLMDNFEDEVDIATNRIKDTELHEALSAILELPPHGLKIIITTRIAPKELALIEPSRQRRLDLDEGLEHPYAENVLRAMDVDGKIGLRGASEQLLQHARERTRGYPRALEHLFGILSADRDTTLKEILDNTEQLLPKQVIEVLVGEAFSRLDVTAQRVIQALATYRYPVPPTAVDFLLQPFVSGIDSGLVLSRLVNMQFVHRDAGRYYLHQIDRDYAQSRVPEGDPADRGNEILPFTRYALHNRAAEWFKLVRKPRENWKTLEDLSAQLSEFDLRCEGKDYDTAAALLLEFDFDCLDKWGHVRLMTELHERIQGKITDPDLQSSCIGNLGWAYENLGRYEIAKSCFEEALRLSRERKARNSEGVWLCHLGNYYFHTGQTNTAIDYFLESIDIARETNDQAGEAVSLGNLGVQYEQLGQTEQAIDYYEEAVEILREIEDQTQECLYLCNLGGSYIDIGRTAEGMQCLSDALNMSRETGYRAIEATVLCNMGDFYITEDKLKEAETSYLQAIEIADYIADVQTQKTARGGLATTYLFQDRIADARKMIDAALTFNYPLLNDSVSVLLAVVTHFQNDLDASLSAFKNTITLVDEKLNLNPDSYDAYYTKGLALCGLSLFGNKEYVQAAKESYLEARSLNSTHAPVKAALQIFDLLARADKDHILAEVRPYLSGEKI